MKRKWNFQRKAMWKVPSEWSPKVASRDCWPPEQFPINWPNILLVSPNDEPQNSLVQAMEAKLHEFFGCENRLQELSGNVCHAPWNVVDWYSFARQVVPTFCHDTLLTFWAVLTNPSITLDCDVQMRWDLRHWKAYSTSFPTSPHGPS